jgi:hypothetical protein
LSKSLKSSGLMPKTKSLPTREETKKLIKLWKSGVKLEAGWNLRSLERKSTLTLPRTSRKQEDGFEPTGSRRTTFLEQRLRKSSLDNPLMKMRTTKVDLIIQVLLSKTCQLAQPK